MTPFFSTQPITGVFCEFRNTGTSNHFHNGTDIPKADGSSVYPVFSGVVNGIGSVPSQGDNAYVRVRYTVGGREKSDAYVHINPNPLLQIGDSVRAYETVLGTILPGLGHVHFTNGYVGSEINAIRPVGGLTPFVDVYRPGILSVRFFLDEREIEFVNGRLSGLVDVRVRVADTTAADPGGISSSTVNNGTYLVGYKILSADRSVVVYEPPSSGVRYRFETQPSNAYVGRVFAAGSDLSTHIYTVTNGDGADYINSTRVVNPNAWNSATVPVGNYTVMVFAQDTRRMADTEYVPVQVTREDVIPPAVPRLMAVVNDSTNRITVRWYPNTDPDLLGYRLYYSSDGMNWSLRENETRLGPSSTSVSYSLGAAGTLFFRLAAVDSASPTNVSGVSDAYGVRFNTSVTRTLVVDGFDRTEPSGSYHEASHVFAVMHGHSIPGDFSTCANEALAEGPVSLGGYQVVDWLLGDESTRDSTFTPAEQSLVMTYLRAGGKLFVSGSEVAYTLDRPSGPSQGDRDFLRQFLKARYAGDDADIFTVTGAAGTVFHDLGFRYGIVAEGSPYEEDWPDYVTPEADAQVVLHYGAAGNPVYAGVGFRGIFPGGMAAGGVVYAGFPFETVTTRSARDTLMQRVYRYLNQPVNVYEASSNSLPLTFELQQNYPNPFNPTTHIGFSIPPAAGRDPTSGRDLDSRLWQESGLVRGADGSIAEFGLVSLRVYDVLGREVTTLVNEVMQPGAYTLEWDASGYSSGVYFCRLEAGRLTAVKKMMVAK